MDNHLPLFENDLFHEGPTGYLNFHLHQTQVEIGSEEEKNNTQFGYFSLKHCLADMLVNKLENIDPITAGAKGKNLYHKVRIFDNINVTELASLIYVRPGGYDAVDTEPGIYLFLSRYLGSLNEIRQLTGMPFPDPEELRFQYLIPLATYTPGYGGLYYTKGYEKLLNFAIAYIKKVNGREAKFPYQLTYKGDILQTDQSNNTKSSIAQYVIQHYFDNIHESIKALISADLNQFDKISPGNHHEAIHSHAYVLNDDGALIARIQTIPIHEASTSNFAGIVLKAMPNIETLEDEARINLKTTPGYDRASSELLLAAFKYNYGYSLDTVAHRNQIIPYLSSNNDGSVPLPNSPFCVSMKYVPNGDSLGQNSFHTTEDHYHFNSLVEAIQFLLHTDYAQFTHLDVGRFGYKIAEAEILGKGKTVLAYLKLDAANKQDPLSLQVMLVIDQNAPLTDDTMDGIQVMEGCRTLPGVIYSQFCVPVAMMGKNEIIEPLAANIEVLEAMLEFREPHHKISHGQAQEEMSDVEISHRREYIIELYWHHPKGHDTESIPVAERTTIIGLPNAHQILVMLEPLRFLPNSANSGEAHLVRANLLDAATQSEIAARFYVPHSTEQQPSGHYLQYNLEHSETTCLVLLQNNLKMLETASDAKRATYAFPSHGQPPSAFQHPRIIGKNDEKDHRQQKLT